MTRGVIVNADDFGQSEGINRGIVEAHERGIVTSASLMVHGAAAAAAAAYARARPGLSVGLHVDLCESLCLDGEWVTLYERVDGADPAAVAAEVREQVERFRRLLGRDPTHVDSHQHVHRDDPARTILIELTGRIGVPLRHFSPEVRHDGGFYGQTADGHPIPHAITGTRLADLLRCLPGGVTELGCHPGYVEALPTMYREERAAEVRALCAPEVRRALDESGVTLISFLDITPSRAGR